MIRASDLTTALEEHRITNIGYVTDDKNLARWTDPRSFAELIEAIDAYLEERKDGQGDTIPE